jgi:protein-tyrosine phosphatase
MTSDQPTLVARPYRVLAVCTGNVCRSPAVERLLAAGLDAGSGVQVASAGVGAVVGAPIPIPMASLLQSVGVAADGFVARQLTEQMLRSADLVLALTRAHRSTIVEMYPGVVRRTFTVRELARLAGGVDPAALPAGPAAQRLAALLPLAAAQRGLHPPTPGEDDVVDPFGGTDALYRCSFDELYPAVAQILRVVRG